ncbi:MAG TPA: hypothetical protein VF120_15325 [Ktedonobacterales bacterium]
MSFFKRDAVPMQAGHTQGHAQGLPDYQAFAQIDQSQARLLEARTRVRQAMEEFLVTYRIVERPRPLPPTRDVDAFIDGLGLVNGILLAGLDRILGYVQTNQLTPEKGLEQANALVRWALAQFLPEAQLQDRRWPQPQYAMVGPLVQLARYLGIATHLAESLWQLRRNTSQTLVGSPIPPSTAA